MISERHNAGIVAIMTQQRPRHAARPEQQAIVEDEDQIASKDADVMRPVGERSPAPSSSIKKQSRNQERIAAEETAELRDANTNCKICDPTQNR